MSLKDLISGETFSREDIITIQDPQNPVQREIDRFYHRQVESKVKEIKRKESSQIMLIV